MLCHERRSALIFSWRQWRPDVESEMEEEIVAVCGHPELYDTTMSYLYKDRDNPVNSENMYLLLDSSYWLYFLTGTPLRQQAF